jgi:ribonuclease P protein component
MLPLKYRLPAKQIPNVARKGRRSSAASVDIKFLPDNSIDTPKFALIVSKKVDNRATVRNAIRRKIRVLLIELLEGNGVKPGMYLVLVKAADVEAVLLELEELLR